MFFSSELQRAASAMCDENSFIVFRELLFRQLADVNSRLKVYIRQKQTSELSDAVGILGYLRGVILGSHVLSAIDLQSHRVSVTILEQDVDNDKKFLHFPSLSFTIYNLLATICKCKYEYVRRVLTDIAKFIQTF